MTAVLEAWRAHCATCNENAQSPFESFAAGFAAGLAAEREACAKVCDALRDCEENTDGYRAGAGWCGEAIRSRGT